jgi:hypothetical protein
VGDEMSPTASGIRRRAWIRLAGETSGSPRRCERLLCLERIAPGEVQGGGHGALSDIVRLVTHEEYDAALAAVTDAARGLSRRRE